VFLKGGLPDRGNIARGTGEEPRWGKKHERVLVIKRGARPRDTCRGMKGRREKLGVMYSTWGRLRGRPHHKALRRGTLLVGSGGGGGGGERSYCRHLIGEGGNALVRRTGDKEGLATHGIRILPSSTVL